MSFISSSTSSLLDKRPHLPLPNEHDRHPKSSSNSSREDGEVAKLSIQLRLQAEPIWKSGSSLTFPCAAFYDGAIAGHARRLERTSRNGLKVGAEALPVTALVSCHRGKLWKGGARQKIRHRGYPCRYPDLYLFCSDEAYVIDFAGTAAPARTGDPQIHNSLLSHNTA